MSVISGDYLDTENKLYIADKSKNFLLSSFVSVSVYRRNVKGMDTLYKGMLSIQE